MSTLSLVAYCVLGFTCFAYGCAGLIKGHIVMRMPDGTRVRYDKETNSRGYYVSVGLLLGTPFIMAFLCYVGTLNST